MKVAVASSDGKNVNQDFGHTGQFLVFDVQGKKYSFLEKRQLAGTFSVRETNQDVGNQTMELLVDCKALIVSKIPPTIFAALRLRGITAYVIPGFIEDALDELKYRQNFEKKIMRRA